VRKAVFLKRYWQTCKPFVGVTGVGRRIAATVAALERSDGLPGLGDIKTTMLLGGEAWVRKVQGTNLWLWYTFTEENVVLHALADIAPKPLR
jgi:hypothetical protein